MSSALQEGYIAYHYVLHNHCSVLHVLFFAALKLVTQSPAYYNE
jgi:hypothetical protein